MIETTENKIRELIESILNDSSIFLVDIELKGNAGNRTLWVYVDSEKGGVNIDECAKISNELGFLIDAHNMIDRRYRLNVSSPGLDRPLVDLRQYRKNKGRKASVKFKTDNQIEVVKGILKDINDDDLVLEKEDKTEIVVDFKSVLETKILAAW